MLLAPMGCAVMVYNKPDTRQTWDNHVMDRYYVETSREHYQCDKIWIKAQEVYGLQTVFFKHQYITVPIYTKADAIMAASTELIKVLQNQQRRNNYEQKPTSSIQ